MRTLALFLSLVLALGFLYACSGGEPDTQTDGDDSGADDDDNGTDGDSTNVGGLTWQNPPPSGTYTWQKAIDYCNQLSFDGHSDWRLPTIRELRSLIRGCPATETDGSCNIEDGGCLWWSCRDTSCEGCSWNQGPATGCYWPSEMYGSCYYYWSSSPVEDADDRAWYVHFGYGVVGYYGHVDDYSYHVRCVRR